MTTIITAASSTALVAQDLITDRSITLKVILSLLCTSQLCLSWVVALLYTIAFIKYSRPLELILTWLILALGNYVITGVANAVIYYRRWSKSAITKRRKAVEENKDAWVMLRLMLSLLGLAPLGRYIETIVTIQRLLTLERTYLTKVVGLEREVQNANASIISGGMSETGVNGNQSPAVLLPGNGAEIRRPNNTLVGLKQRSSRASNPAQESVMSGASELTSVSKFSRGGSRRSNYGVDERAYRKVRRARRQMRRCENDAAQLALFSGFFAAAPMTVAQIFIVLYRSMAQYQEPLDVEYIFAYLCIGVSGIWATAALCHYYPAKRTVSEVDFERGMGLNRCGTFLLFVVRLIFLLSRCLALGAFASVYYLWTLLVIAGHWLMGFTVFLLSRVLCDSRLINEPLPDSVSQAFSHQGDQTTVLDYVFYGYVGIFEFINGNEGRTRARYLIYYFLYYLENLAIILAWYFFMNQTAAWYRTPILLVVLIAPVPAFLLLQIYLFVFHSNRGSVSLCGFCIRFEEEEHLERYSHSQPRESLFGTSVGQSGVPFFKRSGTSTSNSNKNSPKNGATTDSVADSHLTSPYDKGSDFLESTSQLIGARKAEEFLQRNRNSPIQEGSEDYVPQLYPGGFVNSKSTEILVRPSALLPLKPQQKHNPNFSFGGGNRGPQKTLSPVIPVFREGDSDDSSSDEDAIFIPKPPVVRGVRSQYNSSAPGNTRGYSVDSII